MTLDEGKLSGIQLAVSASAIDGDAAAIYHLVSSLLGDGMPMDAILFDVIGPVQRSLGHRWMQGDYLISEEHAATAAIETVIAMLVGSLDQPDEGSHVVISAVEGDTHSLPGRMIAADLLYRGYRTTLLGASMPAEDLAEYLIAEQPDFLVLTCAMTTHLVGAAASITAAHSAGVPVLVGGSAFGDAGERAGRLGADGWVAHLRQVADQLDAWAVEGPAVGTDASAAAGSPAAIRDLAASKPLFVTGASAALATQAGEGGVRYYEELSMLFDVLVAAMAAGDEGVVGEFADWMAVLLDVRGEEAAAVTAMITALKTVVAPASAEAANILDRTARALGSA